MARDDIEDEDDAGAGRTSGENAVFVLKAAGVSYAVGLFWNDVDDPSQASVEARKVAARPGVQADLFCVRQRSEQYGLGKKVDGQQKSMPALAGHLADSRPGSWCGVFAVDSGYYLIAVQDHMIVEDTFVADEVDARAKFDDRVGMSDWTETYAPDSFGVDGAKDVEVGTLLTGKAPRLQEIDRVNRKVLMGIFALGVCFVVGGVAYYYKVIGQEEIDRQMAEMQRMAALHAPGSGGPKAPPAPWEGQYKAVDYLRECKAAMAKAIVDVPGWRSTTLVCDGHSQVTMTVVRTAELGKGGGTINWIRWALNRGGMSNASAAPVQDGNSVVVSWDFAAQPDKWKPADVKPSPEGPDLPAQRRYLQSQMEEVFTLPTFTAATATAFYKATKFTFKTQFEPSSFSEILGRVNGLVVSKVTLDLKNLTYVVEGQANEQLPSPIAPSAPGANVNGPARRTPVASR